MIIKSGAFFSFKQLYRVYVDDHDDAQWASDFKTVQKSLKYFYQKILGVVIFREIFHFLSAYLLFMYYW